VPRSRALDRPRLQLVRKSLSRSDRKLPRLSRHCKEGLARRLTGPTAAIRSPRSTRVCPGSTRSPSIEIRLTLMKATISRLSAFARTPVGPCVVGTFRAGSLRLEGPALAPRLATDTTHANESADHVVTQSVRRRTSRPPSAAQLRKNGAEAAKLEALLDYPSLKAPSFFIRWATARNLARKAST
jgi:hypothetical protein